MEAAVVLRNGCGRDAVICGGAGRSRFCSFRLANAKGIGDFEGDGAGLPVVSGRTHDRSATGVGRMSAAGREGVEFLRGEPWGVGASTVDGERPKGDSGLLNGEARCDVNVLDGVPGLDYILSVHEIRSGDVPIVTMTAFGSDIHKTLVVVRN
jgi:hypothetical protein